MGFFKKITGGLKKTSNSFLNAVGSVLSGFTKIDEELFEELEESLILCDIGVSTSTKICDILRKKVKEEKITDPGEIKSKMKEIIREMLNCDCSMSTDVCPTVIIVIGVNGVGKTTTIGKLAMRLKNQGKSIMLGAADTFRAAASQQLEIWANRAGVPIIKGAEGTDPASVVFDTLASAKAKKSDIVICDTAGRLHNKKNLMEELAKINRIVGREMSDGKKEVLLVLDATTGQNAVNQAVQFSEATGIDGIVLTKLDGTAKGGIVIRIMDELKIPVKFIGVGEQIDDLMPFDAEEFVTGLFGEDFN